MMNRIKEFCKRYWIIMIFDIVMFVSLFVVRETLWRVYIFGNSIVDIYTFFGPLIYSVLHGVLSQKLTNTVIAPTLLLPVTWYVLEALRFLYVSGDFTQINLPQISWGSIMAYLVVPSLIGALITKVNRHFSRPNTDDTPTEPTPDPETPQQPE